MHIRMLFLYIIAFCWFTVSCDKRELVDPDNAHYIRVYIKDNIKNITYNFYDEYYKKPNYDYPGVLKVLLYDKNTKKLVQTFFLNHSDIDENGYYIDGYLFCDADDYIIMIYNWDTESVIVKDENDLYGITAYTDPYQYNIGDYDNVYNTPDLFYTTHEELTIHDNLDVDTLFIDNHHFEIYNITKTFFIEIPFTNGEYISNVDVVFSNIFRNENLYDYTVSDTVKTYFNLNRGKLSADSTTFYNVFNAFDVDITNGARLEITVDLTLIDNSKESIVIDITDLYLKAIEDETYWIILDNIYNVSIPDNTSDGFRPDVTDWVVIEEIELKI